MDRPDSLRSLFRLWIARADAKTVTFVERLPRALERAVPWWICAFLALVALRIAATPATGHAASRGAHAYADLLTVYGLIALSPILALRLGQVIYRPGYRGIEPGLRLTFVGRWRQLDWDTAGRHPLYGPTGFMASLLLGMLLNVVFRSGEFLLAVPAMGHAAPDWGRVLFLAMAADVIVMNFLYVTCFVMALRSAPMFPRMLAITWGLDIAMQLMVAQTVHAQGSLPAAVAAPLAALLEGNVQKVLISAALWLPYLLLSDRVNITYRRRLAI